MIKIGQKLTSNEARKDDQVVIIRFRMVASKRVKFILLKLLLLKSNKKARSVNQEEVLAIGFCLRNSHSSGLAYLGIRVRVSRFPCERACGLSVMVIRSSFFLIPAFNWRGPIPKRDLYNIIIKTYISISLFREFSTVLSHRS